MANAPLHFEDQGAAPPYERVLTATVHDSKITLCFQDQSHGQNFEDIVQSLKDAYDQRVKNWT